MQTFLLVTLVILGLVLTYLLWYGSKPHEDTEIVFQEAFFFEEPKKDILTIVPSKIVMPLPDDEFVVCRRGTDTYHEIWKITTSLLSGGDYYELKEEDISVTEDPSIVIYFDPAFPIQAIEGLPNSTISNMAQMYLYLDNSEAMAFLLEGEEGMLIKFNDKLMTDALEIMLNEVLNNNTTTYSLLRDEESIIEEDTDEEDTDEEDADKEDANIPEFNYSVTGDIFLPAKDLYVYSNITLAREQIKTEDLLKAVFVNEKLARRVEEPDGTLIFTDGEKGLRISENVEYTAPRLEKGITTFSYGSAVQKANEYICYYGGWPDELYLEEISLDNSTGENTEEKSYYARWVYYYEGFAVVGSGVETKIRFNDLGLYYYNRSLLVPTIKSEETIRVPRGEEALKRAFEIYVEEVKKSNEEENGQLSLNVKNVSIVYYIKALPESDRAQAHPVWVININDETIYLDVSELTLVRLGESDEYIKG